jgi:S1-C subfamily serine protease
VGADVRAIGHPEGESWSFTKGVISQYRIGFEWGAKNDKHKADVIQTQTPINPGNADSCASRPS